MTGECSRAGFKENAIIGEGAMKGKQVVSALVSPQQNTKTKLAVAKC